jgi:hypothetical protein
LPGCRLGESGASCNRARNAPDDFFPGAPDITIEIASPSDQWSADDRVFTLGIAPAELKLDIDAIIRDGS